jgi:Tfp pilus assembly protein PilO
MAKLAKEKMQHIVLVGAGTVVVLVLLWMMVLGAQLTALKDRRQKTIDTADEVAKAERLVKSAEVYRQELDAAQAKLDEIENGMAAGDLYLWMDGTIKNFVAGQRVQISSISREEKIPVGLLPDFPYDAARYIVRGNSHYHDFGLFVAAFENNFPYMRLQNLELQPADTGPGADREKLAFKVDVVTLLKPLPKTD